MAQNLATKANQVTASRPWQQPDFLVKAVRDVGGASGYDPRTTYALPTVANDATYAAAQRWLRDHAAQIEPIGRNVLSDWLIMLGANVASSSKLSESDVKAKIAACCFALSDAPAYLFTEATLKSACKHFTWFPATAELSAFLNAQCREQQEQVYLTKRLAERGALAQIRAAQ